MLPPHLWVWARLGSDLRPQSPAPALPTAQEYHYHASPSLWQTTVALGMEQTRWCDLCVWQALLQQQVTFHSTDRASPAQSAMLRNFNTTAQGVFGFFWSTLSVMMDNPLKLRIHGNCQRLLGTKKLGGRERWSALCSAKGLGLEFSTMKINTFTHTPFSWYVCLFKSFTRLFWSNSLTPTF